MDALSVTFQALADPTRRAILAQLASGEHSVTELAAPFDMSLPGISKHLKVLEHAGLISRSREAQWRPCKLEPQALKTVDAWLDEYRGSGTSGSTGSRTISRKFRQRGRNVAAPGSENRIPADEPVIAFTRLLDVPRELVWKVWTDPRHVTQWWGPTGFSVTTHAISVKPGGRHGRGMSGSLDRLADLLATL
ncbi:MAG: metalloregulator ArsR/SmtB family transcription factor [Rhizomicrobium sp.]